MTADTQRNKQELRAAFGDARAATRSTTPRVEALVVEMEEASESDSADSFCHLARVLERESAAKSATIAELREALVACYQLLDDSHVRNFVTTKQGEQAQLHRALNMTRRILTHTDIPDDARAALAKVTP